MNVPLSPSLPSPPPTKHKVNEECNVKAWSVTVLSKGRDSSMVPCPWWGLCFMCIFPPPAAPFPSNPPPPIPFSVVAWCGFHMSLFHTCRVVATISLVNGWKWRMTGCVHRGQYLSISVWKVKFSMSRQNERPTLFFFLFFPTILTNKSPSPIPKLKRMDIPLCKEICWTLKYIRKEISSLDAWLNETTFGTCCKFCFVWVLVWFAWSVTASLWVGGNPACLCVLVLGHGLSLMLMHEAMQACYTLEY